MRVIWAPAAVHEVQHIHDYVMAFNPRAARRLAAALLEAGDRLVMFPLRGRLVDGAVRELTVVHPYIIRYEVAADAIYILRVRHGMRAG